MSIPSDEVMAMLGTEVTYTRGGRRGQPDKTVTGTVTAIERTYSVITNQDGQWHGFRLRIKPSDGSRAFWTVEFPDTTGERLGDGLD